MNRGPTHYRSRKSAEKKINLRQLQDDLQWEAKVLAVRLLIKKSVSDNANNLWLLEADTKFITFSNVVEKEIGRVFTSLVER